MFCNVEQNAFVMVMLLFCCDLILKWLLLEMSRVCMPGSSLHSCSQDVLEQVVTVVVGGVCHSHVTAAREHQISMAMRVNQAKGARCR